MNLHTGARDREAEEREGKKFSRAPEVVYFERLKRQHRWEPPPGSLLPLPFSSLLRHLSSVYIDIDAYIFIDAYTYMYM